MSERALSEELREFTQEHWDTKRAAALEAEVAESGEKYSNLDAQFMELARVRNALAAENERLRADVENQKCLTAIAEGNLECGRTENTVLRARIAEAVKLLRKDLGYVDPRDVLAVLAPEGEAGDE